MKGGWAGVKVTPASEVPERARLAPVASRRVYGGRALHPLAEHPLGRVDIRAVVCTYKNQPRLSVYRIGTHTNGETLPNTNVIQRGAGPCWAPRRNVSPADVPFRPGRLCLVKTKWRRFQEQPHEAQRSSQGQHTVVCSVTFQRTHHHPLDTTKPKLL